MRRLCLPLLLAASPALAEIDVRQLVIDTARASDCVITEEIAEATFPKYALTLNDLDLVLEEMIAAGEAELTTNELHLSPTLCDGAAALGNLPPPVPTVSPLMGRVIAVFRQNGCSLTEAAGLPALAAAGIAEEDLETIGPETEALIAAGLMIRDEATATMIIAEPLCSGAVVADPSEPLIRMLRENGCALTQEAASALVAGYGLTMATADEMADNLMTRGLARVDGERLMLLQCNE